MDSIVRDAIAAQYDAFRSPAPREIEGCPCCITPAELDTLVRVPRERLTADQLTSFAFSAPLTVGDVAALRHYWPRLAELSIAGELLTDEEIVFAKPRHGEWRQWPAAEREALALLVAAQIEALVNQGAALDAFAFDGWVCAFGQFFDVTTILHPLLRMDIGAAAVLRGWYMLNERSLARGKLRNAFWDFVPDHAAKVRAWFGDPAVLAAIDRAFMPPLDG